MRLIDADELLKRVDEERQYLLARGQTGAEHILVHNFRDLIDNAPTVEGEILTKEAYSDLCLRASRLRPQGEWIVIDYDKKLYMHSCSNLVFEYPYNYCPNCGASMIRGEEG